MTPKEKAIELVDKFYYIPNSQGIFMMQDYQVKQCALILANEIYDEVHRISLSSDINLNGTSNHWYQVKQEIEKL
jgi:hypothetical protein